MADRHVPPAPRSGDGVSPGTEDLFGPAFAGAAAATGGRRRAAGARREASHPDTGYGAGPDDDGDYDDYEPASEEPTPQSERARYGSPRYERLRFDTPAPDAPPPGAPFPEELAHPGDPGSPAYAADPGYQDGRDPSGMTGRDRRMLLRQRPPSGRGGAPAWMGAGRPAVHRFMRSRRHALMALGGGAVALAGFSSTMAVLLRDTDPTRTNRAGTSGALQTPRDAGGFANRDDSFVQGNGVQGIGDINDLGASGLADTPSRAAQLALAATPKITSPLIRDPVLHLLRRTTFGPTPQDIVAVKQQGIDAWIERQLNPGAIPDPGGDRINQQYPLLALDIPQLRAALGRDKRNEAMAQLGPATIGRQIWTSRQLQEVMVDFWANHLNIENPFGGGWDNRTDWDRMVIRKHALGKFSDMLLASARHPAMLRYLDNAASDKRSVNENYGRELLELHTVGVDGGYNEKDVRNAAYVMTGRTVDRDGNFTYDAGRHWTGAVKVMGWTHTNRNAADGLAIGDSLVRYLATHPSTAKYIARKLAVRFVSDHPPGALVERLAKAYLQNGTAIVPVLRVLFRSVEFWIATGLKTRRPLENLVASARVLGVQPGDATDKALEGLYRTADRLGHAPLAWAPPDGYPDVAAAWQSTHGMLGSWNSHRAMVQGMIRGFRYLPPEQLAAGNRSGTVGGYVDALAQRVVFQPLSANEKNAMLKFIGATANTRVTDPKLGGRVEYLAPLFLDTVYHGLR